ncbi:hypothetical protein AB0N17_24165, partial [Streptomyces sp. NPDC051133]|uniref:SCO4983 family protein n=1 Tax=Streptomyces sp. NPDC051133 TaxID=3155521 RepID=UPI003439437D
MYEPIRTKSVHSTPMAGTTSDFPHRSREEELDIQLAGHLAALLTATDELRALAPCPDLDAAAERLAAQVARLRGGRAPLRAAPPAAGDPAALHRRAHALCADNGRYRCRAQWPGEGESMTEARSTESPKSG